MALMSVFDTPSLFQVVCGIEELGWVHPLSFTGFGQRPVIISLGGRAWEVIRLDEDRSIAQVRPTEERGRSRWLGESRALSYEFCQAIHGVLIDDIVEPFWSKRAKAEIVVARSENTTAGSEGTVLEADERNGRVKWWTFGGLKANASLAGILPGSDGVIPRFDNYYVEIPNAGGLQGAERRLRDLPSANAISPSALGGPSTRVKFWECLPEDLQDRFTAARFSDPEGALKILSQKRLFPIATDPAFIDPNRF
jgi:ATP-dependent Lhr-like helicase